MTNSLNDDFSESSHLRELLKRSTAQLDIAIHALNMLSNFEVKNPVWSESYAREALARIEDLK